MKSSGFLSNDKAIDKEIIVNKINQIFKLTLEILSTTFPILKEIKWNIMNNIKMKSLFYAKVQLVLLHVFENQ